MENIYAALIHMFSDNCKVVINLKQESYYTKYYRAKKNSPKYKDYPQKQFSSEN